MKAFNVDIDRWVGDEDSSVGDPREVDTSPQHHLSLTAASFHL